MPAPTFYLRSQVSRYVILFLERDGSTYLSSLLMSHPAIQAVFERFVVLKQNGAGSTEQLEWARNFYSPPLIGRYAALGFKTKLVDVLDPEGFAALLMEKECRIIHMQRRNRVKAVISKINARRLWEKTGNWNLYEEKQRMPPADIDPEIFDALLCEREQLEHDLQAYIEPLQLPKLKVVYEELLVDQERVLENIFRFLGVKPYPVVGKSLKNTSDDLRDAILNFEALRERYAGTVVQAMFDEVLVQAAG